MWILDLIGTLFGLIIVVILLIILMLLVCGTIVIVGSFIEEVNEKEDGLFHKIMNKYK